MTEIKKYYDRLIAAMDVEGLEIPLAAVKFYRKGDDIPAEVKEYEVAGITLTSCQAKKQAALGDAVLLTAGNIGCLAAGISLGLIDKNQDVPLPGARVYTDIMKEQSGKERQFVPPSPKDFTDGIVYAAKAAKRYDFCLFGKEDSGRYETVELARKAVSEMTAIQPAVMAGVFFYSPAFEDIDLVPDVVVMSVRPVELARIGQAYQFKTAKRVTGDMGSVRVVCSDLIARPYLEQKINFSSYCLGARLIARYDADRLGIGFPMKDFAIMVEGMEASRTGFPFQLYPGA